MFSETSSPLPQMCLTYEEDPFEVTTGCAKVGMRRILLPVVNKLYILKDNNNTYIICSLSSGFSTLLTNFYQII